MKLISYKCMYKEEAINTWTHGIGMVGGLIACIFLSISAFKTQNDWIILSILIYCLSLMSSYISSTFYHGSSIPSHKHFLRKFDHSAIFIFIAGSYTPFTLITLRNEGAWGWALFSIVWGAAIIGVLLSFLKMKKSSNLKTICYLAMGWVVIIAFKPLLHTLQLNNSMNVLYWLIGGGLFYTIGSVFFFLDKYKYMHPLWHIFVMGGTACHFWAIYLLTRL